MGNIVLDENGQSVFGNPREKLEKIENILRPKLQEIKLKIERNERSPYPQKLNFLPAITNILDANLRKNPLVKYNYAIDIGAEELQEFANAFFDLLLFIRDFVPEYIANKQTFCAFASISVNAFNILKIFIINIQNLQNTLIAT